MHKIVVDKTAYNIVCAVDNVAHEAADKAVDSEAHEVVDGVERKMVGEGD